MFSFAAIESIREADAVVVNGEGTIHHGGGLHLLAILDLAIELGKGAFLINATLEEIPEYQDVLSRLDDLVVREGYSAEYARALGANPRVVADSILEADFHDGVDALYNEKIVLTDCHHARRDVYHALNLVSEIFEDDVVHFPLESLERVSDWKETLRKFRAARLVVTGRYHGVYLAAMAGTRFVALPSNSWKVPALLEALHASNALSNCEDLISKVTEAIRYNETLEPATSGAHPFFARPLTTMLGLRQFFGRKTWLESSRLQKESSD
ncbi:polysaccharide pyruvyl transferase family protein [Herbaspirillum sp. B65]|uniref:polysaccharide pyruvyl transferase family protein n=1 Tax=Herbaspirillum sp. B65 TaxID=137708 RepID=UPI000A027069|nr:polysaccharide pyruvyl transferase family protein [Herbaspirillum sp. B65]